MKFKIFIILLIYQLSVFGQSKPFISHPKQLDKDSFAEWISPKTGTGLGVYYFRKHINIKTI